MNIKKITYLTFCLVFLSCFSFTDDDDGAIVYNFAGFAYSFVLYLSMHKKPLFFIPGLILLGVSNLFVYFASALIVWLPESISVFLFFLFPSIVGALITIFVLTKMWFYKIDKKFIFTLIKFISLSSILSSSIIILVNYFEIKAYGLFWSINCIFWWIAFTYGLIVNERSQKALII